MHVCVYACRCPASTLLSPNEAGAPCWAQYSPADPAAVWSSACLGGAARKQSSHRQGRPGWCPERRFVCWQGQRM